MRSLLHLFLLPWPLDGRLAQSAASRSASILIRRPPRAGIPEAASAENSLTFAGDNRTREGRRPIPAELRQPLAEIGT
jgi:hypothetical protein